jgi:hypothetical protein
VLDADGGTPVFNVDSTNERAGIGTAAIPHGGVGLAKLAVEGANSSAAGPHMQFTTASDDYPLLQMLPFAHDNVALSFDAYLDSGLGWKSSDPGSNFQIYKLTDVLRIRYDSGITAGNAITWNEGIALTASGGVGIGTAAVPHGAIGGGIFAIEGVDSSIPSGPHVQFTTAADDYPLIQYLNYSHDNIQWQFDAYFDGSQKSSDAGSNFRLAKVGDRFQLQYNAGTAQGVAFGWSDGFSLLSTGRLGVGLSTGQGGKLHVDQNDDAAAIPVLVLDQADVDEPFTKFIGTAAAANLTRSIVDNGDVTTATLVGWTKIEIDDIGNQVTDGDYFQPFYSLA